MKCHNTGRWSSEDFVESPFKATKGKMSAQSEVLPDLLHIILIFHPEKDVVAKSLVGL